MKPKSPPFNLLIEPTYSHLKTTIFIFNWVGDDFEVHGDGECTLSFEIRRQAKANGADLWLSAYKRVYNSIGKRLKDIHINIKTNSQKREHVRNPMYIAVCIKFILTLCTVWPRDKLVHARIKDIRHDGLVSVSTKSPAQHEDDHCFCRPFGSSHCWHLYWLQGKWYFPAQKR